MIVKIEIVGRKTVLHKYVTRHFLRLKIVSFHLFDTRRNIGIMASYKTYKLLSGIEKFIVYLTDLRYFVVDLTYALFVLLDSKLVDLRTEVGGIVLGEESGNNEIVLINIR